jgi:hypothetical protein
MSNPEKKAWKPMQVRFVGDVSDVVQHHSPGHAGGRPRGPRGPRVGTFSP